MEKCKGVFDGVVDGELGVPVEFSSGFLGVGPDFSKIARATGRKFVREWLAIDVFEGLDYFEDRSRVAGTEIIGFETGSV